MKVYDVSADVTNCQCFYVCDKSILKDRVTSPTQLHCISRLAKWKPPEVYVSEPLLTAGDFYDLGLTRQLILSPLCKYAAAVERFFTEAGEMLPIFYEGREYKMLNVLHCIDCLDREKSEWFCRPDGRRLFPHKKMAFYPDRVTGSSIFKIPELMSHNLTVERNGDPKTEFKAAYEHYGLTGLIFDPVWEE
jgi:hypothetical protein